MSQLQVFREGIIHNSMAKGQTLFERKKERWEAGLAHTEDHLMQINHSNTI